MNLGSVNEYLSEVVGQLVESDTKVANIILKQMGGAGRIRAMTGAKQFIAIKDGLQFRFPNKAAGKPNFVKIELTPADLYDVEFGRIRGGKYKKIKEYRGVYFDMLISLFEKTTGLYLRL
jgi:hypothetical protein